MENETKPTELKLTERKFFETLNELAKKTKSSLPTTSKLSIKAPYIPVIYVRCPFCNGEWNALMDDGLCWDCHKLEVERREREKRKREKEKITGLASSYVEKERRDIYG